MAGRVHRPSFIILLTAYYCYYCSVPVLVVAEITGDDVAATEPALFADDECEAGAADCTLSAVQLRARRLAAAEEASQGAPAPTETVVASPGEAAVPDLGATSSVQGCAPPYIGLWYSPGMNCAGSQCCMTPGMQCYEKVPGIGGCMYVCYPGVHFDDQPWMWQPWSCRVLSRSPAPAPPPPPLPAPVPYPAPHPYPVPAPTPGGSGGACHVGPPGVESDYELNWQAKGQTFFDDFVFIDVLADADLHGAAMYVSKEQAEKDGMIEAHADHAIMRIGDMASKYKRKSVRMHTKYEWNPHKRFVMALHYKHLPFGCGVWPAWWTLNTRAPWPQGGELDVIEYSNQDVGTVSFHTDSKKCRLNQAKVQACKPGMEDKPTAGQHGAWNCETNYYAHPIKFGCAPNGYQQNGQWLNDHPGMFVVEWGPTWIKVFYMQEDEIPQDLHEDRPNPETWDRFIISFFPFDPECVEGAKQILPQEMVFNTQLCGDLAGTTWDRTGNTCPSLPNLNNNLGQCKKTVYNPGEDCCTKYVADVDGRYGTNDNFRANAYWDVKSVKVYTPNGKGNTPAKSGTYERGGKPFGG